MYSRSIQASDGGLLFHLKLREALSIPTSTHHRSVLCTELEEISDQRFSDLKDTNLEAFEHRMSESLGGQKEQEQERRRRGMTAKAERER